MSLEKMFREECYHEAGHAVAAFLNGHKIVSVRVTDEGAVCSIRFHNHEGPANSWRIAVGVLAGPYALLRLRKGEIHGMPWPLFRGRAEKAIREQEATPEEYRELERDEIRTLDAVRDMAAFPFGGSEKQCYLEVVEGAKGVVADHWLEIEAVARAIEAAEDGILEGEEAERIIREVAGIEV